MRKTLNIHLLFPQAYNTQVHPQEHIHNPHLLTCTHKLFRRTTIWTLNVLQRLMH